jgi:hypothetical protein
MQAGARRLRIISTVDSPITIAYGGVDALSISSQERRWTATYTSTTYSHCLLIVVIGRVTSSHRSGQVLGFRRTLSRTTESDIIARGIYIYSLELYPSIDTSLLLVSAVSSSLTTVTRG